MKKLLTVVFVVMTSIFVFGDSNSLSSSNDGDTITADLFNQYFQAFRGNIVPRNSSGVPTDLAGTLGESAKRFLKAFIASGYWNCGDIKYHEDFGGTKPVGQGWMKADGRVVNQTNYDTEHGAGAWATYIVSSCLDGVTLPDFDNMYAVGETTSSQWGDAVGNSSHQINIAHTHTMPHTHSTPNHVHKIFEWTDFSNDAEIYNSSGNANSMSKAANSSTTAQWVVDVGDPDNALAEDAYTNNSGGGTTGSASSSTTSSELSSTQSIQPRSIKLGVYVRIID